ncbi:MAG: carbon-nitrogen hydrolase family protein, partial [Flavobacteriaceae bacterium]|nr:carbon-nitrogen hydrolase family protein [Flavobacteriaceae bacterium]
MSSHLLTVGLAQISPVWLDKKKTIEKVLTTIETASEQKCELVVFGEALIQG